MKRMSMLASLAHASAGAGELRDNVDKLKEESEKEDVNEVRHVCLFFVSSP